MNYIGSKYKLSSWLKNEMVSICGGFSNKVFCDIFAGTGAVAKSVKKESQKVIANDI